MSFSSKTKDEITKQKIKDEAERRAVLGALTHAAGSISLSREGVGVRLVSENHNVARLYAQLANELYGLEWTISISQTEGLNARNTIVKLTGENCRKLLQDAGCIGADEQGADFLPNSNIPAALVAEDETRRAFIRGAFLGCGSITDPKKGYHLEFVCRREEFAYGLCELMYAYGINAKYTERKNNTIVYLKDGDDISDAITLVGGMNSTMEFEHARILRGVSNDLNRQRNFENANMQKAAEKAAQQLVDIELIAKEAGLNSLPPRLYAAAEARLNNPEATLNELAEMLDVSKSGINHRLNKLCEIANELRLGSD